MAEYDLTHRITQFFDVHLVIPILEFVGPRRVNIFKYEINNKILLRFTMKNRS